MGGEKFTDKLHVLVNKELQTRPLKSSVHYFNLTY